LKNTIKVFIDYKLILTGINDKLYTKQGINTINPIIIGNSIVQQYDINWSKRILGKEALTQINTKINMQALIPNVKLYIKPWTITVIKLTPVSINEYIIVMLKK